MRESKDKIYEINHKIPLDKSLSPSLLRIEVLYRTEIFPLMNMYTKTRSSRKGTLIRGNRPNRTLSPFLVVKSTRLKQSMVSILSTISRAEPVSQMVNSPEEDILFSGQTNKISSRWLIRCWWYVIDDNGIEWWNRFYVGIGLKTKKSKQNLEIRGVKSLESKSKCKQSVVCYNVLAKNC